MRRVTKERIAAATVFVVAAALVIAGAVRTHRIYDQSSEEFGLLSFTRVSDAELIVDATFSGVKKAGARLYTAYDRSEPRGKRSCPT